jgi:hypothetical protein
MKLSAICRIAAALVIGAGVAHAQTLPSSEQQFKNMVTVLRNNDNERKDAIASCIQKGIGYNPRAVAEFMEVPVADAATAWCTRTVTGLVNGTLSLADLDAMNSGTITPGIRKALKTP